MPAQDANAPFDYRPVGAVAGAALPTASLLEYLLSEYPQYRKILESAENATLPNGNVDLRKVMEKIKPGDFGLSGLQGGGDPFTSVLVRGSHAASGGPGAHGQVAGPYVRPHWKLTGAPEGEMGRPLSFLMNDRGELYAPEMASNPKAWRARVAGDAKDMTGTQRYGNYKEYIRSRTQRLAQLKAQERAWSAYDAAVGAGKTATPPQVPRPDAAAIEKLTKARAAGVSGMKRLLTDIQENAGKTRTGEVYGGGKRVRWSPTSESGFFGGPTTEARNFEQQLERLTGSADRQENLAKRFDELAAKNPKLKQIAQELRMPRGELLDRLAKNLESRGAKTPAQKRTIESLFEAAGGNQAALPKSKLFKPKQFETFVPSLLHGGMSATNAGQTPLDYVVSNAPAAAQDVGKAWWRKGLRGARAKMRNWFENYQYNTSAGGVTKEIQDALDRRPQELVPHWADTVYKHTVAEGSSQNPRGYYRDPKTQAVGQKPTLWMRAKAPFAEKDFIAQAKRMGVDPYDAAGAGNTAVGEVMGLNRFRRMFGGDAGCRGGHCGAGPARLYNELFKGRFPGASTTYLPNRVALNDMFEPLLVTNKAQALRDLTKGFRARTAVGLGAAGLMGAAGYGLTGLGQGLLRSPKLPPQPKLDPHMFAKSMKLLQPQKV